MNEQQRGEYNALILQYEVYKSQVQQSSKLLSIAVEEHINNPTILTELNKSQAEFNLAGYQEYLDDVNSRLETFLKNL